MRQKLDVKVPSADDVAARWVFIVQVSWVIYCDSYFKFKISISTSVPIYFEGNVFLAYLTPDLNRLATRRIVICYDCNVFCLSLLRKCVF